MAMCAADVDLLNDPRNCGGCGHDCQQGDCSAGTCQPFVLASNQSALCDIAVSSTTVVWASYEGKLWACAKGGCNDRPVVLATGLTNPVLTVDETNVYAAEAQNPARIVKCALRGCAEPTTLTTSARWVSGIAVDSANVYFTTGGGTLNPRGGTVSKCSIDGCAQPVAIVTGLDVPTGIAVDATHAYFANDASGSYTNDGVMKCSLDGCATSATVARGPRPFGVAVDDASVYWTNTGGDTVMKCSIAGCASPTTLSSGHVQPYAIALDATTVYWTDMGAQPPPGTGSVMKCSKRGCSTPTVIASGLSNPCGIAVDATSVYWTVSDAVWKVVK